MHVIHGAVYVNRKTSEKRVLLGMKMRTAVFYDVEKGYIEIPRSEFESDYRLTDEHNHEQFCCSVHDLHVSPHTGCILR